MRDIEDLLRRTMPNDAALPDLDALHRRGVRRRWAVRAGSATTMAAVVAVGALSLQAITPPIIEGDGAGPATGGDGGAEGAEEVGAEEWAVQACMEEEGLRYDVDPGAEPPPAAPTITPSFLTERTDPDSAGHDLLVAAAEERGWLGYRQAMNDAPTAASLSHEWYGAPQPHLWEGRERAAVDRGDAIDSDLEAHGDERDAYVEQLTACQQDAYGFEILDLEQRRLLEQVRGADWAAAKTTGFLAQDDRVQQAQRQRQECHDGLRQSGDLNEVQLSERLDAIAEQAGYRPPGGPDPEVTERRGWGEQQLLDVDPDEVDGLREFVEDTREPTLELLDCERTYSDAVAEVAEERAGEYLDLRAEELRDAGIEVDLGPEGERG